MTAKKQKTIAYYRVSTQKQGKSGLGLEGQVAAVADFVQRHDRELLVEMEWRIFDC